MLTALAGDSLGELLEEELVEEAIAIASSDFYAEIKSEGRRKPASQESLLKYALRMSTRCTPFGLFAGCLAGKVTSPTHFDFRRRIISPEYRLDMHLLVALSTWITNQPHLRNQLRFYPNTSLYRLGSRIRFTETGISEQKRTFFISELEYNDYLLRIVEAARPGNTLDRLAHTIVDSAVTLPEAVMFVEQLANDGILVSELEPTLTGTDYFESILKTTKRLAGAHHIAGVLESVQALLTDPLAGPDRESSIRRILHEGISSGLPARHLLQCDAHYLSDQCQLSPGVLTRLQKSIQPLKRLTRTNVANTALEIFKQRFYARYQEREIPLSIALDAEAGVGYGDLARAPSALDSLISHLPIESPGSQVQPAEDEFSRLITRKFSTWLDGQESELVLTDDDLAMLPEPAAPEENDFYVFGYFLAGSAAALEAGQFRFMLKSLSGPGAFHLMGRFCQGNAFLRERITDYMALQQQQDPTRIHAEIAHLPEFRTGNILRRPHLRSYEIPYLAASTLPIENQLHLDDLMVSVPAGRRVIVRSKRLNKEIVPHLTTAHNYRNGLPVYQFLCDLQQQDAFSVRWSWGVLEQFRRLPRVTYRNIILKEASWSIRVESLDPSLSDEDNVARLRRELGLPAWIALAQGDNELFLDLDSYPCRQLFLSTLRRLRHVRAIEWLRTPEECFIADQSGRYTHEVVIPFGSDVRPESPPLPVRSVSSVPRTFLPGSEWIYLKLYCGHQTANSVLTHLVPVLRAGLASGQVSAWYFVRYKDPEQHVRLRFRITRQAAYLPALEECHEALRPLIESGEVYDVQLATYERELERYGHGLIEQTESIFQADSEAVFHLLQFPGEHFFLYTAAVLGIDAYLDAFEWALPRKAAFCRQLSDALFQECGGKSALKRALAETYRPRRTLALQLLQSDERSGYEQEIQSVLQMRSLQMAAPVKDVLAVKEDAQLTSYVASLIHMFVNRLMPSDQRTYEMVLYFHLSKAYESLWKRSH